MGSDLPRRPYRGREEGASLEKTRRWIIVVSTEAVLTMGKEKGSELNGNPARNAMVGMVLSEYAEAHAEYTGGTEWLGRRNGTVASLDEGVLESTWCRYPRTELLSVGLLEAPHCSPDVRRSRMLIQQSPEKGHELVERWLREEPLYRVLTKYRCNRTFVTPFDEMIYIQEANAELQCGGSGGSEHVILNVPECAPYPPLWRRYHSACSVVKTMAALRRAFGAPVDALDWTLFRGSGVRWDRASGHFR